MDINRQDLALRAASLAAQGGYGGKCSWNYTVFDETHYDRARHEYRGKLTETRFMQVGSPYCRDVFETACVAVAYNTFPSEQHLDGIIGQTPDDVVFGLKVTVSIRIEKFPNLDQFHQQPGKPDEDSLKAAIIPKVFLKPVRQAIGLLLFEFSHFWLIEYENGRDFITDLDKVPGPALQWLAAWR